MRHQCLRILLIATAALTAPAGVAGAERGARVQDAPGAIAEAPPAGQDIERPGRLRVYLDCVDCFPTFLRDEIVWVDFVREPQDADVTLLSTSRGTGGGGREVVLRFVGAGRFTGVDRELRTFSAVADPERLRRAGVLEAVAIGLLGYLAHEGRMDGIDLTVRQGVATEAPAPARDRWNLWVFRVRAGGSIESEETNREMQWELGVSGDRVTEDWKISVGAELDQQHETFDLDDGPPIDVHRQERSVDWFIARSMGPHWSVGLDGRVETSTFDNLGFSAQGAPAIEYSIFPYSDYATRQLLVQYQVGLERARYNEVTLFDKTEEMLWRQELSARLDQQQPWGSLRATAEWSQYLHDRALYRLEAGGRLSLRIARGLSFDVNGSASRIRDQLSLPRRSATSEEVLLRLRELQSGYEVELGFGISYSFGSIFNNVVNPRFGG